MASAKMRSRHFESDLVLAYQCAGRLFSARSSPATYLYDFLQGGKVSPAACLHPALEGDAQLRYGSQEVEELFAI
ncbi:MAG: hypothetical protein QOI57_1062, partial [Rubrobacteraceae bacterium]|nr:hypothetical protein [Rubrobacteraceae bacterium]